MNGLRRRIWMIRHGLSTVPDPEAEIAQIEARFESIGDRFVETYRAWSRANAEE